LLTRRKDEFVALAAREVAGTTLICLATRLRRVYRERVKRNAVLRYIAGQEEHHRKISFEDEFLSLLRKHGVSFDPNHVFD